VFKREHGTGPTESSDRFIEDEEPITFVTKLAELGQKPPAGRDVASGAQHRLNKNRANRIAILAFANGGESLNCRLFTATVTNGVVELTCWEQGGSKPI
jgi:hypothetical protein